MDCSKPFGPGPKRLFAAAKARTASLVACVPSALPLLPRLEGLGTRVRDQGRAPLDGRFTLIGGKSMRRKTNMPMPRQRSRPRKVIAMITSTREGPLPPDWLGVWVLIFSPVRAGALVGLAPGVCVTLVAVAFEVAAVGDRLVVALGDAPVVGDEDETAGRVERSVVDGLDVDVLVGDGQGVDVAVGDGDGLGVGD